MSRRIAFVAVLLGSITLAGWPAPAPAAPSELPPPGTKRLARLFRPEVKPLGLRVTRALLQDIDTYKADPEGTHLAIYVEPRSSAYSGADYVRNFTRLTNRFLPRVFERWPGLESFDICHEPLGDPREAPPPATQIFVTRGALDRVADWRAATLAELLAGAPRSLYGRSDYYVYFASWLHSEQAFVEAARTAGWTTPTGAFGR